MPPNPSDDLALQNDVDPMELADAEDDLAADEEEVPHDAVAAEEIPVAELVPELEHEVVEVLATEEPSPKQKTQMISQDLINRELTPDDLMDAGSL